MIWDYPYGILAGMVSICGYIYGNIIISLLLIICFGLFLWIVDELNGDVKRE